MSLPNNPAFNTTSGANGGITVREYYAAAALNGLLSNPIIASKAISRSRGAGDVYMKMFCATSFLIADYMVLASAAAIPVLQAQMEAGDTVKDS